MDEFQYWCADSYDELGAWLSFFICIGCKEAALICPINTDLGMVLSQCCNIKYCMCTSNCSGTEKDWKEMFQIRRNQSIYLKKKFFE